MYRKQHQKFSNRPFKFIIIFLAVLIVVLLSVLVWGMKQVNEMKDTKNSHSVDNLETVSKSNQTEPSTSIEEIQTYDFAVDFSMFAEKSQFWKGSYGTLPFAMTLYPGTQDLVLVYNIAPEYQALHPDAHLGRVSGLVAKKIPTLKLKVNENSEVKIVNINTQLFLSDQDGSTSLDFYEPFNGNDTDVYAYVTKDGNIALAFTPDLGLDQYQVIVFTPKIIK